MDVVLVFGRYFVFAIFIALMVWAIVAGANAETMYPSKFYYTEGFLTGTTRCGVGLAPCRPGTACLNGFCKTTEPPTLSQVLGLPVKPSGYSK